VLDIPSLPNLGEYPHLILTGLAGIAVYLLKRAVDTLDANQAELKKEIEGHTTDISSLNRQVRDTRAAVACCETAAGIQHYPYTD
jgi:hypothetical protein